MLTCNSSESDSSSDKPTNQPTNQTKPIKGSSSKTALSLVEALGALERQPVAVVREPKVPRPRDRVGDDGAVAGGDDLVPHAGEDEQAGAGAGEGVEDGVVAELRLLGGPLLRQDLFCFVVSCVVLCVVSCVVLGVVVCVLVGTHGTHTPNLKRHLNLDQDPTTYQPTPQPTKTPTPTSSKRSINQTTSSIITQSLITLSPPRSWAPPA